VNTSPNHDEQLLAEGDVHASRRSEENQNRTPELRAQDFAIRVLD